MISATNITITFHALIMSAPFSFPLLPPSLSLPIPELSLITMQTWRWSRGRRSPLRCLPSGRFVRDSTLSPQIQLIMDNLLKKTFHQEAGGLATCGRRVSVSTSSAELLVGIISGPDGGSGSRSRLETLFEPLHTMPSGGLLLNFQGFG